MNMISITAGPPRRKPSRVVKALVERLAEAAKRRRIRREMQELSQLSRHLLRDMGLDQYAALNEPTIPNHWR